MTGSSVRATVYLSLIAGFIITVSPAAAETTGTNSLAFSPALKCADLTGLKIPGSTMVIYGAANSRGAAGNGAASAATARHGCSRYSR